MIRKALLFGAVTAALAIQGSALGATPPSHAASASCKAQLLAIGEANFDKLYTTTGECISDMSKLTATQRKAVLSAERTCRAAQTANPSAFEAKYGSTTKHGKNAKSGSQEDAFGKCVSQTESA